MNFEEFDRNRKEAEAFFDQWWSFLSRDAGGTDKYRVYNAFVGLLAMTLRNFDDQEAAYIISNMSKSLDAILSHYIKRNASEYKD